MAKDIRKIFASANSKFDKKSELSINSIIPEAEQTSSKEEDSQNIKEQKDSHNNNAILTEKQKKDLK